MESVAAPDAVAQAQAVRGCLRWARGQFDTDLQLAKNAIQRVSLVIVDPRRHYEMAVALSAAKNKEGLGWGQAVVVQLKFSVLERPGGGGRWGPLDHFVP